MPGFFARCHRREWRNAAIGVFGGHLLTLNLHVRNWREIRNPYATTMKLPILVVLIAVFVAGCSKSAQDARNTGSAGGASTAQTLVSLDGSSTVFPISEAVAEEFQKAEKGT